MFDNINRWSYFFLNVIMNNRILFDSIELLLNFESILTDQICKLKCIQMKQKFINLSYINCSYKSE